MRIEIRAGSAGTADRRDPATRRAGCLHGRAYPEQYREFRGSKQPPMRCSGQYVVDDWASVYALRAFPAYVHLNARAIVSLK